MSMQVIEGALRIAKERRAEQEGFDRLQAQVDELFRQYPHGVSEQTLIDAAAAALGVDSSLAAEAVVSLRSRNIARKDWTSGRLTPIPSK